MADFPKLRTDAVLQYPAGRRTRYSTTVQTFLDGSEQRFRERAGDVREWIISLDKLTDAEAGALERFFEERQGSWGMFRFLDPWDDVMHENCSFTDDALTTEYKAGRDCSMRFVIRRNDA